ncbi:MULTISPECIES: hypothetical protein [Streptomyces]|uniref:hypothetical protein n=1 Tax=Streptomyces TaxID=1883 RepID=UPI000CD5B5E7|nr:MULTISPECIES: hypothetical protein [Streptomyces]
MSVPGSSFEADPQRLAAFISECEGIASEMRRLAPEFRSSTLAYHNWMGVDDSDHFYKTEHPRWNETVDQVEMMVDYVAQSMGHINEANFHELREIQDMQSEALEDIAALGQGQDSDGVFGGGRF